MQTLWTFIVYLHLNNFQGSHQFWATTHHQCYELTKLCGGCRISKHSCDLCLNLPSSLNLCDDYLRVFSLIFQQFSVKFGAILIMIIGYNGGQQCCTAPTHHCDIVDSYISYKPRKTSETFLQHSTRHCRNCDITTRWTDEANVPT